MNYDVTTTNYVAWMLFISLNVWGFRKLDDYADFFCEMFIFWTGFQCLEALIYIVAYSVADSVGYKSWLHTIITMAMFATINGLIWATIYTICWIGQKTRR